VIRAAPTTLATTAAPTAGGNQALTNGTPTANDVPPMPRKNPADEQCRQGRMPEQPEIEHGQDRDGGDQGKHDPAAEPVGQRTHRDPAQ
jgi:hypothetical protein